MFSISDSNFLRKKCRTAALGCPGATEGGGSTFSWCAGASENIRIGKSFQMLK
jgi:hypothetical protein